MTLRKPEGQELNPVVYHINKTEHQIKYHEQTLSESFVPDMIETIEVLYLIDQTCLSA